MTQTPEGALEVCHRLDQRLETLIREFPMGIFVHRNFKPIVVNDELARMFGYSCQQEIFDLPDCRRLFPEEEWPRLDTVHRLRIQSEASRDVRLIKMKGKRHDGSLIDLENRGFALQWGEQAVVCVLLTDVTDAKALEHHRQHAEHLAAIEQLAGGVAHDFNNLLTVILANAEMIAEKVVGNMPLSNFVHRIKLAAENGAQLVNRLLSFGRREVLVPKAVDVNMLLLGVNSLLRGVLGQGIEISILPGSDNIYAYVDPLALENALINICINARDAMPNGGILRIRTEIVETSDASTVAENRIPSGVYVLVEIADTGTGVAPEILGRVFGPFFTTKEAGKGCGLGLSLVHGFVKQSNGHIEILSDGATGTTVRLYLPRSEVSKVDELGSVDVPSGELPGGNESILVVAENPLIGSIIVNQLWALGYRVASGRNGPEAMQLFEQGQKYDLLISDIMLPGYMNGHQLAEKILEQEPELSILFTSGNVKDVAVTHSRRKIPLLRKPFTNRDLAEKVRMALEGGAS